MDSQIVLADRLPNLHDGTLIDPRDVGALCDGLDQVREKARELQELRKAFEDTLLAQSQAYGTKTLRDGEWTAEVTGGPTTEFPNPEELERDLRAAGMPEERIREIVVETVSYRVKGWEAKRVSAANVEYANIVSRHRVVVEKPYRVSVKRA